MTAYQKRALSYLLIAVGLYVAILAGFGLSGMMVNQSESMPLGVYRKVSGEPIKGSLISVCLTGTLRELAEQREYLRPGECLIKRVAGIPGETMHLPAWRRRQVDSMGRPIPQLALSDVYLKPGEYFVTGEHERSFDSRYFGAVPRIEIASVLVPVITF